MDKEALFKVYVPEAKIELQAGTIRVRGLTRAEIMVLNQGDPNTLEQRSIAKAMVEPTMTLGEVLRWYDARPAGELQPVADKVMELSGFSDDAAKEAVKEFEADPDAEFRDVPGAEIVDDGGAASPADG